MMLLSWMPFDTARDLGWTLFHFLWQGVLLAALLATVLPLCRSAVARHNCALATLALMALAPVATFLVIHDNNSAATTLITAPLPALPATGFMVVFWFAGMIALSLRALGGWHVAASLAHRDTLPVPAALLDRCHALQRRLAVTEPVRFLLSSRIAAPIVVGWLKPVILIPVSAIAGLSPQQLDALVLHELAHIRRLDTVTNIALTAIETVLFYHPAVWWVARQVRIEREHCCDDVAVSACGDVALYVEALTALQPTAHGMALAASGGELKRRAARLLAAQPAPRRESLSAITGLALLGLLAGSLAMAQAQTHRIATTAIQPIRETHTLPPYPKDSIHLKETGVVLLAVTIGTDGTVSKASVFKPSGHPRLDDAALRFVKANWKWQPATRAGKAIASNTKVSVKFDLKEPAPKPATRK